MKQGFDGMLLDATSDYDAMTPPSSPLQARTRRGLAASGQGSSQNLLEVPGTSTHSEASKKGLGFREEEEENTAEGEEIKDDDEERGKEEHPRFFVMKSFTQFDIDISKEKSIWATQPHNERKLNDAFDSGSTVVLFFSVNGSGKFQGCAKMTSKIGTDKREDLWKQGSKDNGKWGGTFSVEWISKNNVDFIATSHILNPLNEGKPVKVGRDGQEMTLSAGIALLNLFLSPAEIERFLPSLRGRFTSFTRWGRRKEPDSKKTTKQPRQSHQQNFYVPPLPSQEKNFEQPPLPPPPPPQQHFYQRRSGYSSGRGVNSKRHRGHFRNVSGSGGQFYSGPPLPPPPPLQMPIPAAFVPMHEPPRRMKMYTHSVPYMAPPPNVYTNFYPFGQPENPFPEYYNLYRSFVVPPPPPPPQQQQPQQPQPMPPPQNSIQEQEPNEKKN